MINAFLLWFVKDSEALGDSAAHVDGTEADGDPEENIEGESVGLLPKDPYEVNELLQAADRSAAHGLDPPSVDHPPVETSGPSC